MKLFAGAFSLLTVSMAACLFFAFEATQKKLLPINQFFYSKGVFRLPVEEDTRLAILTIDDAPSSRTSEILDLLSRYNAKATFFVHTDQISGPVRQNVITKILSEGHEIGHHMPKDKPSVKLSENNFVSEFARAEAVFKTLQPENAPKYFRAAGGYYNTDRMDQSLIKFGYDLPLIALDSERRYIMASYIPWDAGGATNSENHAKNTATARRYGKRMADGLFPGAIIVFHDGEDGGRDERLAATLVCPL